MWAEISAETRIEWKVEASVHTSFVIKGERIMEVVNRSMGIMETPDFLYMDFTGTRLA
jgi:hypothetical protein